MNKLLIIVIPRLYSIGRVQVNASMRHVKTERYTKPHPKERHIRQKRLSPSTIATPLICLEVTSSGSTECCVSALELYQCQPSGIQRHNWPSVSRRLQQLVEIFISCCVFQKVPLWLSLERQLAATLTQTQCTIDFVKTTPYLNCMHMVTGAALDQGQTRSAILACVQIHG